MLPGSLVAGLRVSLTAILAHWLGASQRALLSSIAASLWESRGSKGPPSKLLLFSLTVIPLGNLDYVSQRMEEEFTAVVRGKVSRAGVPGSHSGAATR